MKLLRLATYRIEENQIMERGFRKAKHGARLCLLRNPAMAMIQASTIHEFFERRAMQANDGGAEEPIQQMSSDVAHVN
jgi:hypothetical protein